MLLDLPHSRHSVTLDQTGNGRISRLVDNSDYVVMSRQTGCFNIARVLCSSTTPVFCFPPSQPVASQGDITIEGAGASCKRVSIDGYLTQVCNDTTVTINVDGTSISATATPGTTAAGLAAMLASAVNNHPVLQTKVVATVAGNVVNLRSVLLGTQYGYPWQSNCDYSTEYFTSCGFRGTLSPDATLAPR